MRDGNRSYMNELIIKNETNRKQIMHHEEIKIIKFQLFNSQVLMLN